MIGERITILQIYSLCATLVAIIPINVHLGLSPTPARFGYALVNTSLAFFLLSFQVHEKSILIPLLPVSLMLNEEPQAVQLFMNVAMFRYIKLTLPVSGLPLTPLFRQHVPPFETRRIDDPLLLCYSFMELHDGFINITQSTFEYGKYWIRGVDDAANLLMTFLGSRLFMQR